MALCVLRLRGYAGRSGFDLPVVDASLLGGEIDTYLEELTLVYGEFTGILHIFYLAESLFRRGVVFQFDDIDELRSLDPQVV